VTSRLRLQAQWLRSQAGAISFSALFRPAEPTMRRVFARAELDGSRAANIKYWLIVAVLCAATLTVALAIAAKLAALPAGSSG